MDVQNPQSAKIAPKKKNSTEEQFAEIARKTAGLSKDEVSAGAKEAKKKDPKPLPNPNARKWLERIKRSEKVRKPFLEDAERFYRMYQGDYSERPNKKRRPDTMSVNVVYSHVEIVTPAVYSGFPFIRVRPKPKVGEPTDQLEAKARNMELVINYWFKELATDEELQDVFLDTFFGPAIVELGWETEIEDREELNETEDGAEQPGESVVVIVDRPFITRREFKSLFLDPDARRRRDCRWIAVEEVVPYNDFIASS